MYNVNTNCPQMGVNKVILLLLLVVAVDFTLIPVVFPPTGQTEMVYEAEHRRIGYRKEAFGS